MLSKAVPVKKERLPMTSEAIKTFSEAFLKTLEAFSITSKAFSMTSKRLVFAPQTPAKANEWLCSHRTLPSFTSGGQ